MLDGKSFVEHARRQPPRCPNCWARHAEFSATQSFARVARSAQQAHPEQVDGPALVQLLGVQDAFHVKPRASVNQDCPACSRYARTRISSASVVRRRPASRPFWSTSAPQAPSSKFVAHVHPQVAGGVLRIELAVAEISNMIVCGHHGVDDLRGVCLLVGEPGAMTLGVITRSITMPQRTSWSEIQR